MTIFKRFVCVLSALLLVFLFCFSAFSDAPAYSGVSSALVPLSYSNRVALLDCIFAEQGLGVLRTTSYEPVVMCVFTVPSGSLQIYEAIVTTVSGNRTITGVSHAGLTTSFTVTGPHCVFVFSDTASGGFVYSSYKSSNATYDCSSVLYYRTGSLSTGVAHDLTGITSTQITGSGSFSSSAVDTWLAAWNAKLNGPSQGSDRYDEGFYDGYETGYDIGYESGIVDGWTTGYNDGYDDGFDIGYETGFSDGFESGRVDAPSSPGSDPLSYQKGLSDGINSVSTLSSFLTSIPSGLLHAFIEMLDIQIWGLKLYVPFIAIIVLFVVFAIWALFKRVSGH